MRDVFTQAAQCPTCRSSRFHVYRTCPPETDGTVTRYVQCRECGERFKLITERPEPDEMGDARYSQ